MSQENHVNESIINEEVKEFLEKGKRTDHMKYLPDMEVIQSDVMDKVREAARNYDYSLYTEADVRRALAHDYKTPEDFKALLSPAALPFWRRSLSVPRRRPGSTSVIPFICSRLST